MQRRDAKVAKDTKDAKVNRRGAEKCKGRKEKISVFSVVFLCLLWFFLQSVQICVNRWTKTTDSTD